MNHAIDIQVDDELHDLVDQELLASVMNHALETCQRTGELALVITDDVTIQQLNRDYRGIDAPTDVLSFANQDPIAADVEAPTIQGLPPELVATLNNYLGDIIIAYPYAERQATTYQNSIAAELRLLAVHGLLHLLGYDHGTAAEEAEMWALQREILAHFGDTNLSDRIYQ